MDIHNLTRLLDMSKDPNKVPKSEIMNLVGAISSNSVGEEMGWNFVTENWQYFIKTYDKQNDYRKKFPKSVYY